MLLVGLTGGIGSGKSTVGRLLAERGAVVIEADRLARDVVEPGTPGFDRVVETFGPGVVTAEGSLDRDALARIVFEDAERRRALEGIVHPEVARRFAEEVERQRGTDRVVVYAVPLLVERGLAPAFDVVIAVSAPEEVRVARVVAERGSDEAEVRARIAAQVGDAERAAVADLVIDNTGGPADLARAVDAAWDALVARSKHR
ncbi:MAG TPA: dephospho-CoA kinase [Actinomycetota bacterium]|jgi:dephospho-CoA kinase